jgi:8-oxo-dGTP pyrophosphatase MutT (NUDIX family)
MIPKPPAIKVEFVNGDPYRTRPFFELQHWKCRLEYPDGSVSEDFYHDIVKRKNPDAVVILAHYIKDCEPMVYLRSCVRPSLAQRFVDGGNIWELPAGVIEKEHAEEAAAREIEEELGFKVEASQMRCLGSPALTCVGMTAEMMYFYHVKVDPISRGEPKLDGSPLERHGVVVAACLSQVKCMISSGQISDLKTEVAIRRFERLANLGSV